MDPQAAYDIAADPNVDLLDRIEALLALEEWDSRSGWMPAATDQDPADREELSNLATTIAKLGAFASDVARHELY